MIFRQGCFRGRLCMFNTPDGEARPRSGQRLELYAVRIIF